MNTSGKQVAREVETTFSGLALADALADDGSHFRTIKVRTDAHVQTKKTIELVTELRGQRDGRISFRAGREIDSLRRAIAVAGSRIAVEPTVIDVLQCGPVRVEVSAGHNGKEGAVALTVLKDNGFRTPPIVIARSELVGLSRAVAAMKGATL